MRNVAAVAATQKDGEHRYYLPKKYLKKNEGYLVKESQCGCLDIYKINRLEQKSWSKKYKKSIDCSNPKGFSQKAHCAGRKKTKELTWTLIINPYNINDFTTRLGGLPSEKMRVSEK